MKRSVCLLLIAALALSLTPAALAQDAPEESGPTAEVAAAITLGLVPDSVAGGWQQPLTREEFAMLAVSFLSVQYGYGRWTGFGLSGIYDFFEDYMDLRPGPNGEPFLKSQCNASESTSWEMALRNNAGFFADVPKQTLSNRNVNLLCLLGIVSGDGDGRFAPDRAITRQEAAAILTRAYETYAPLEPQDDARLPFADGELIATWAAGSVSAMDAWGVLPADENRVFSPDGPVTREEGIAAFFRLYQNMPISRCHGTLSPLLTQAQVIDRFAPSAGQAHGIPTPNRGYYAETALCTIAYVNYGGVMHPPESRLFLFYPDSTYRSIAVPLDPESIQINEQETGISFSGYMGRTYSLDLKTGRVYSAVPADAWYAPAAALCTEMGLAVGMEDGLFAPEAPVSENEAMLLALQLHHLIHGGDGTFEPAPEDWGSLTLTVEGEEPITAQAKNWTWLTTSRSCGCIAIPLLDEEMAAWGKELEGRPATLTMPAENASHTAFVEEWHGIMACRRRGGDLFLCMEWEGGGKDPERRPDPDAWSLIYEAIPLPGDPGRDAVYYQSQMGLLDWSKWGYSRYRGTEEKIQNLAVSMNQFAKILAAAVGDLPAIRPAKDLPGLSREDYPQLYMLREAGILAGDEGGGFDPEQPITRAQAAAMAVRVLDESLRITEPTG